jgi:hypothetical protein
VWLRLTTHSRAHLMIDWLELVTWIVALALLHEGLSSIVRGRRAAFSKAAIVSGAVVLLVGAGLWYWNARAFLHLADALRAPPGVVTTPRQAEDLDKLPLPQRRDLSMRLAQAVFVSGGGLPNVATEDGRWAPYSPSASDVEARDQHLKLLAETESRRQDLTASAQFAEKQSMRWLVSLAVAVCIGLAVGRLQERSSG